MTTETMTASRSSLRPRLRRGATRQGPAGAIPQGTAMLSYAGVVSATDPGGRCTVGVGAEQVRAERAASCLVAPVAGDTVAYLRAPSGEAWVIAVLQREQATAPLVIASEGALCLQAAALRLAAAEIGCESEDFALQSARVRVHSDEASLSSAGVRIVSGVTRVVGTAFSSVFDRVSQFSRHYLRTTRGLDRVHADHVECEAKHLLRLQAEHAVVQGEKLVKTRGGQIHFG